MELTVFVISTNMGENMTKEEFQELLKRYKAGDCSPEELQKINTWFSRISNEDLELSEWEKEQIDDRMLSAIRQQLPSATGPHTKPYGFQILKIAASLILLMLVGYLLVNRSTLVLTNGSDQIIASAEQTKYKNTTRSTLPILLPDSSIVELEPNAEIFYAKEWNDQKREVHLVGEAFFEVVKDSKRPFYVYGGEVVTKVLGTSFTVKAAANAESVEVAVRTGKVSVYEGAVQSNAAHHGGDAGGVVLTPNEKVEFFINDKHWVTSLVAEPKPLPASNKAVAFVFSNTPMSEILKSIERTYSIDIITENETSYPCTFTGDVSMMELYDILDVICKSTGTNYEVKGTKILVTGRGCQ